MKARKPEAGGVELLEESILALRATPAPDWFVYCSGAIPFVAALLWFCTDSLRNVNAASNLAGGALTVALLFVWKQFTEAMFAARLHARITGLPVPRLSAGTIAKALMRLTAIQPWSILVLLIAALATVPAAAAVFFFRGFSLFTLLDPENSISRAWTSARGQQGQAWRFLALTVLVSIVLYVNFLVATLTAAMLSKSFFGIDYLLSDPRVLLRSSTIHASVILLVYLCTDALFTAAAVLRCFYSDSIRSGADILAGIRRLTALAAIVVFALCLCAPLVAQTDTQTLDRALDETLARREFAWRMPPSDLTEPPAAVGWTISAYEWLMKQLRRIGDWLDEWMRKQQPHDSPGRARPERAPGDTYRYLMIALVVVAAIALVVIWRSAERGQQDGTLTAVEPRPAVDVSDEATLADHLSEDSWLSLADELIAKGDHRLALRALYLSGLRLLSERKLVTVQRWKSGYEYLMELKRRSREPARMAPPFQESLRLFELGWYGFHPVDAPMLDELRLRLKELRSHASA